MKSPERIGNDNDWVKVFNLGGSFFAQKSDGSLWGWGGNYQGQLGVADASNTVVTPLRVGSPTDCWKVISSHYATMTFAIRSDGTLWSWGAPPTPRLLGRNGDVAANVPGQIGSDTDWDSVVTDYFAGTYAVKKNGTLWVWGTNQSFNGVTQGTLGVPTTNEGGNSNISTPVQVGSDSDWDKVLLLTYVYNNGGWSYSPVVYARKRNGTLWAWGGNGWYDSERGALGVGSTDDTVVVPTKMTFE